MRRFILLFFAFALSISFTFAQSTKASYYHSKFNGRKTASGQTYFDHLKTAASNVYKLGTQLLVTNRETGKSVKVVVNDRMATRYRSNRVDLSKSAFSSIASHAEGLVPVEIKVLNGHEETQVL